MTAELIDCHDLVIVAANLQKLIDLAEQKSDKRSVTFALNSGVAPNEVGTAAQAYCMFTTVVCLDSR